MLVINNSEDLHRVGNEYYDAEKNILHFKNIHFNTKLDFSTFLDTIEGACNAKIRDENSSNEIRIYTFGLEFKNINININIIFERCVFEYKFELFKVQFHKGITFKKVTFKNDFDVTSSEGNINFLRLSIFEGGFNCFKSELNIADFSFIDNIVVEENFKIIKSVFKKTLILDYIEVKKTLLLIENSFGENVTFKNSKLENALLENNNFEDIDLDKLPSLNFSQAIINSGLNVYENRWKTIDISNSNFKSYFYLESTQCKSLNAIATTFDDSVLILKSEFILGLNFTDSIFNSTISLVHNRMLDAKIHFVRVKLYGELFLGNDNSESKMMFAGEINFDQATIYDTAIVRFQDINNKELPNGIIKLTKAVVKGGVYFNDVFIRMIHLKSAAVPGFINHESNQLFTVEDWESACILKNEFKKNNNQITYNAYYKKEMKCFSISEEANFWDKVILYLNKWSNNFGTSWARGILFTFLSSLLFFAAYYLLTFDHFYYGGDPNTFFLIESDFWCSYLNYFWILAGFNLLLENLAAGFTGGFWIILWGVTLSVLSILSFVIGKIMIGYGTFQTIKAFRKYI
ncbi:hypothetical protein [Flavobacterium sp. NKUCC04_CG]|uniref:hypothetical protein n=1 Tax=Flavobacterium sp. NKUCC04_CG TaxID=2842121 RepID=UPI001C5A6049|nr:hypothetical protein [Flavobacterium sp. NKUCC04_CG]MBW3519531.1 hypothetical protein [Flavobacterium sp. NKUCC04_CG]